MRTGSLLIKIEVEWKRVLGKLLFYIERSQKEEMERLLITLATSMKEEEGLDRTLGEQLGPIDLVQKMVALMAH